MKSYIFGVSSQTTFSGTKYLDPSSAADPFSPSPDISQTLEAYAQTVVSEDCEINSLTILLNVAPGSGDSITYTLRVNGVSSVATVTISESSKSGRWFGSVALTAGDLICLERTFVGTPAASNVNMHLGVVTSSDISLIPASTRQYGISTTATRYCSMFGADGDYSPGSSSSRTLSMVPNSGTLKKFRVTLSAAPGTSKSYAVSVRINGVDYLTVTISGSNTTGTATIDVPIVMGDAITIKFVPSGTPAAVRVAWCITYEPTNIGEMFVCAGLGVEGVRPDRWLDIKNASYIFDRVGSTSYMRLPACTVKDFYMEVFPTPNPGVTTGAQIVRNRQATGKSITIVNPAISGSTSSNNFSILEGDSILYDFTGNNTGPDPYLGLVLAIPQTEPSSGNFLDLI